MQRRKFGNTALDISVIGFDCRPARDEDALRLMKPAFDLGITFFDAGNGQAETALARFLKTIPRDRVQIGGRFGYDFAPQAMRLSLEQSLHRLGVETLDLYLAQDITLPRFRDDLFAELEKVKGEGKIKVWGVSLGPEIGWREEGLAAIMSHNTKAVQSDYSLWEQDPGREFCQVARAYKAGILARVPDYGGNLHAKKLERVQPYAANHGMTPRQLAFKWLLMDPAVTGITATLRDERAIREAAESPGKPDLTAAEMQRIAMDYANDWNLGPQAHPRDLKSSIHPAEKVRSGYVPPPILIA